MRISRQQMFMEMAEVASKRSTCVRNAVGAVITYENRVISIGYNGPAAGEPHCTGSSCPLVRGKCVKAIHAEVNAINFILHSAHLITIGSDEFDLYVTTAPCLKCASHIKEQNIKRIFFKSAYGDFKGLDHLKQWQRQVYQLTSSGYILRYPDKAIIDAIPKQKQEM